MRVNKLFKRPKSKNGEGRSVKIKHILLPEEVTEDLRLFRDCYSDCLGVKVSFEQMMRRWMDQVGRFDPDVAKMFDHIKTVREEEQKRLAAGLGLSLEQLKENEAAFNPADPENKPWKLSYFFIKDGKQVEARPGVHTPFYAFKKGRNVGMKDMLAAGWSLQNENGDELDFEDAWKINKILKQEIKTGI